MDFTIHFPFIPVKVPQPDCSLSGLLKLPEAEKHLNDLTRLNSIGPPIGPLWLAQ